MCTPARAGVLAVYVVFGATGGIGSEIARRLAKQDGPLVVLAGRDEAKLEELSQRVGGRRAVSVVDALNAEQVCALDITFGEGCRCCLQARLREGALVCCAPGGAPT